MRIFLGIRVLSVSLAFCFSLHLAVIRKLWKVEQYQAKKRIKAQGDFTVSLLFLPLTLCLSLCHSVYVYHATDSRKKKAFLLPNKAGYTAIRCVLAHTGSSFGQKWRFCMVSTRVWPTDGRTDIPSYRDARTHLKREPILAAVAARCSKHFNTAKN